MGDGIDKADHRKSWVNGSRPTIGLLIGRLGDVGYAAQVWPGIADVAAEADANLVCFVGGALKAVHEFDSQRNVAYDLARPQNVDGLIAMSGSIGQFVGPTELADFYRRFGKLPMVNIAMKLEGIPAVMVDNEGGMRAAIEHLIEVHHFERIAFLCGPETNTEAQARYHMYLDVLAKHDIPFDPALVTQGNFLSRAGAAAVGILLDERKVEFQAIASANDEMALGAIDELRRRGIHVPDEMSVIGFDDLTESKYFSPPLTTIRQPLYQQGRKAAEMILALLNGESVSQEVVLPTELMVRQSCGCTQHPVDHLLEGDADVSVPAASPVGRAQWVDEMEKAAGVSAAHLETGWAGDLLEAFSVSIGEASPEIFLQKLDQFLRQIGGEGADTMQWQHVISVLRGWAAASGDPAQGIDILFRACSLLGEIAQWAQANRRLQAERRSFEFSTAISEPLMSAFDMAALTEAVAHQLPQMGILSCYLALYEQPQEATPVFPSPWSRLLLAYNRDGRIKLEPEGRRFASSLLIPPDILPREKRFALMLEPLHFRDEVQLGFILFEPLETMEGALRESLSRQISIALKGALLLQERTRAQSALQESEEKYRSLLQFNNEILRNAPIGIIRLDTEMRIEYENPELNKIIGLPGEVAHSRALGTDIRQLPGIRNAGLVPFLEELRQGKNIQTESTFTSIYSKDTFVRINGCPILEEGRAVGSVLLVEDITQSKTAEEALAASEYRYRSLAEASHDMIFIISQTGSIDYVNGFAARQFRTPPEEIAGRKLADFFAGADTTRQTESIRRVLSSNMPLYIEAPSNFPSGELWLGTWLIPLMDKSGLASSVMGVSRDITERKQAEKALKEYSERLEEMVGERTAELEEALQKAQAADRMKTEFLANVNHELRTPLTNLILYYQMLSAYPQVKTQERLEVIGRELQRLRILIENLLNLSRLEFEKMAFRPKPADLNGLIHTLVNDRRALAEEHGLELGEQLSPVLPVVCLDEAMMIQAVSNLLTNAINYTPPGGRLDIRTFALCGASGEAGVVIRVQDSGPGISLKDLPHIFERFYRGSASHETGAPGTGLGLAIVKEVVERHRGHLEVENAPEGHGAIFTIWVPQEQQRSVLAID